MDENMSSGFAKTGTTVADDFQYSIRARFVGTWMLVELEGEGILIERLGANPVGLLIYDPFENMSVQIMNREHGKLPLNTNDDVKAAFQSYVGYFGKYRIDTEERSITHHVVGSLYPRDIGRDFKRHYEFSGDHLTLTAIGLISGDLIAAQLVWKRADR